MLTPDKDTAKDAIFDKRVVMFSQLVTCFRNVVLEAAVLPPGSLEGEINLSWSRLCGKTKLLPYCLGLNVPVKQRVEYKLCTIVHRCLCL